MALPKSAKRGARSRRRAARLAEERKGRLGPGEFRVAKGHALAKCVGCGSKVECPECDKAMQSWTAGELKSLEGGDQVAHLPDDRIVCMCLLCQRAFPLLKGEVLGCKECGGRVGGSKGGEEEGATG